mmetsp:Transcript_20629/g.57554  ORF Transcript_20629/g.57554 Transcript_20629/m.57554 type:complete len:232 (+) Transcript_20629:82-777(+)
MSTQPLRPEVGQTRDALGLKPLTEEVATEEAETTKYLKMLFVGVPVIGQVLAWFVYFCFGKLFKQQHLYDKKFSFLQENQLGYIYLSVWLLCMTRARLVVNANGARAPARVDRPDQHVYKVMDTSGALKDAAYVMMADTGPQGRFNGAQRGVFNTDESLPLTLVMVLLVGAVFGPVVVGIVLLIGYGRITFGLKYKESCDARGAGFLPAMIGEKLLEGLTLLCAIKGIFAF